MKQKADPPVPVWKVALPASLPEPLDYLPLTGEAGPRACAGMRVQVPFRGRERVALLVNTQAISDLDRARLKPVSALLDDRALLQAELLELLQWAADYYHFPLGEVVAAALPALLREGAPPEPPGEEAWRLTGAGHAFDETQLPRAPRQVELLRLFRGSPEGLARRQMEGVRAGLSRALAALRERGLVEAFRRPCLEALRGVVETPPSLSTHQGEALTSIVAGLGAFHGLLLEGVTGSGKTEVYLQAISEVLARGQQALVLVPEIGLTPQMLRRFRRRFAVPVAVVHSGLHDRERLCAWSMVREGQAPILIGTRSAVFSPFRDLGLIVVDEEHDLSYKQQDGFRYSARDLAVMRARRLAIPVLLGSATPAMESLHNVRQGRYRRLSLPERAGGRAHPRVELVDVRARRLREGLSRPLVEAMREDLALGRQVLLFVNRRGFAPTLMCHACGWLAECPRCDARLVMHQASSRLRCHHCMSEFPLPRACPQCGGAELVPLGAGTERIEESLAELFPGTPVERIDRDTTRGRESLNQALERVRAGHAGILVGTQMLAKGHHFPDVALVGILDVDGGFFSVDYRAGERMAQLILQVAGRAGRGDHPGRVVIQTHHPDHPLLTVLLGQGYPAFAKQVLAERAAAELPPISAQVLIRAEASHQGQAGEFLRDVAGCAPQDPDLLILGPVPAPMERRAGRYRAMLLVQAPRRVVLQRALQQWLPRIRALKSARKLRWSVDVDPQEMV